MTPGPGRGGPGRPGTGSKPGAGCGPGTGRGFRAGWLHRMNRRLLTVVALCLAVLPTGATAGDGPPGDPDPRARGAAGERSGASAVPRGAEHAPVLLVPGWGDGKKELLPLRARFLRAGWEDEEVGVVEFEDPVGSNVGHADEIGDAVDGLLDRTGAGKADIVAHSMGGLAVRRYLLDGGDLRVRRVVFLATPHRGTISAHMAWGEGAREMERGSRFLLDLIRARPVPRGVEAITIRTPLDLHVLPNESATLPGFPNLEVCCPTHQGLLDDDATFELIERFLERR